jgi:hypothetical protein
VVSSKCSSVSDGCRIHCAAFKWLQVSSYSERESEFVIKGYFSRTCEKIHSFVMRFRIGLSSVKPRFHCRCSLLAFVTSGYVALVGKDAFVRTLDTCSFRTDCRSKNSPVYLVAFAKLRKATISFVMSVCPSA